jgi:hypothetical protein
MQGNKLTAFLVLLVAVFVDLLICFGTLCCGFIVFFQPYLIVVASTIYLMATGQPMGVAQGKR